MTGDKLEKSYLALKLFAFSCSLPLLFASPAWGQQCSEAEIKANIQKFNNKADWVVESARNAVVNCRSASLKPLIAVVKDQKADSKVRRNAASALVQIGSKSPEVLNALIALVKDQNADSNLRSGAAVALGQIGSKSQEVLNALIAVVKDQKAGSGVRSIAAYALGNIGLDSPEALNTLIAVVKDQKADSNLRYGVASVLGQIGSKSPEVLNALIAVVKDQKAGSNLRSSAAYALGNIGLDSPEALNFLIAVVKDQKADSDFRSGAAYALGQIGLDSPEALNVLIEVVKDQKADSYVLGHAADALGKIGSNSPEALNVLIEVVKDQKADSYVRRSAADALGNIGSKLEQTKNKLSTKDLNQFIAAFETAIQVLEADKENKIFSEKTINEIHAYLDNLKQERQSHWQEQIIQKFGGSALIHIGFWVILIFLYPKYSQVQAIFFWNPKVRKIIGLWYVDFLLTWIPFLRSKLFDPFQESLLSDAQLDTFDPQAYFADSQVKLKGTTNGNPIQVAIPEIQGQIVLEGESGLGKSMFLRSLAKSSRRIVVYLPAQKCTEGVMEAIKNKLHGYMKEDPNFLQSLIYVGAIDICIDGLNEVTPDTRAKIINFAESNFKGNIIMATQSLEWLPPSTAKTYVLQPLDRQQIEQYLVSRQTVWQKSNLLIDPNYEQSCQNYLATTFNQEQPLEEKSAINRMLSNPMDLTIVGLMLAQQKQPDILKLQQQLYDNMAADYEQLYLRKFPLEKFGEAVYEMRLNDEKDIHADNWLDELQCMERYRMVISRQSNNQEGQSLKKWYFRHDKIQEFFIVQTFLGNNDHTEKRLQDHISDPMFRGVYFLLATMMPLDAAQNLRETLIQYAADTKDHTVSDTFVQILRSRKVP